MQSVFDFVQFIRLWTPFLSFTDQKALFFALLTFCSALEKPKTARRNSKSDELTANMRFLIFFFSFFASLFFSGMLISEYFERSL